MFSHQFSTFDIARVEHERHVRNAEQFGQLRAEIRRRHRDRPMSRFDSMSPPGDASSPP